VTGDPDPALAAIDDAIALLIEQTDPSGDDRYQAAIAFWCATLVLLTGSREGAVGELRSLATGCQLLCLEEPQDA
jgi:hypothetical protein